MDGGVNFRQIWAGMSVGSGFSGNWEKLAGVEATQDEVEEGLDQRGHLNRMLRLALPFFVDATCCAQTLAQMRRHPELVAWVRDSCLHEPHRRSSRDRSGSP